MTDYEEIQQGTDPLDADTDNDGINDGNDDCPLDANDDNAGCPSEDDNDNDGVDNENDECPDTPQGEPANNYGCSESQMRDEFETSEVEGLHYSIEMFNLTHGVMKDERNLNTADSNYVRYQLWRLVELYHYHDTFNDNISALIEAYVSERDSSDWVDHYSYKLKIQENLSELRDSLESTYHPYDQGDYADVEVDASEAAEI